MGEATLGIILFLCLAGYLNIFLAIKPEVKMYCGKTDEDWVLRNRRLDIHLLLRTELLKRESGELYDNDIIRACNLYIIQNKMPRLRVITTEGNAEGKYSSLKIVETEAEEIKPEFSNAL